MSDRNPQVSKDDHSFIKDVVDGVFRGEGLNFWRHAKLRKLMEEENCRVLIIGRLNKGLPTRMAPNEHMDDVVSCCL